MERTKEHNKKISEGMKKYFANETVEQREKRREKLQRAKIIQSQLYKRFKIFAEMYEKLEKLDNF